MSLGPLTTSFTPPSDCLPTNSLFYVETSSSFYWLSGLPYQSSCFPSGYSASQDNYFSPAPACPVSYTSACESVQSAGTVTETRVRCCPQIGSFVCKTTKSSYGNPWGSTLECMSVLQTDSTTSFITLDATYVGNETAGSPVTSAGTILAYAINLRYQESDVIAAATTDTSATTTPSGSVTSLGVSETATSSTGSQSSNGGLSAKAAAGIGVGVAVGVILIVAAIAYLFWSRRRQQKNQPLQDQAPPAGHPQYYPQDQQPAAYQLDIQGKTISPNQFVPWSAGSSPVMMSPDYGHPNYHYDPYGAQPRAELANETQWLAEAPGHPVPVEKDDSLRRS
ncbi:hypothetical protein BX600DRAFT_477549 [Xylariales sp. PMI_506]|nr:hypothetical protein BX600DRAFT_477549 [Xylariales sp. PMI_506]